VLDATENLILEEKWKMDKVREIRIEGEGNGKCQGLTPDIKILASPKRGLESERFQQRPHP